MEKWWRANRITKQNIIYLNGKCLLRWGFCRVACTLKFDHPECIMPMRLRSRYYYTHTHTHLHSAIHTFNHWKIIRFAEKCSFCCAIWTCTRRLAATYHTCIMCILYMYRILLHFKLYLLLFYRRQNEVLCLKTAKRHFNDFQLCRHGRLIIPFERFLSLYFSTKSHFAWLGWLFARRRKRIKQHFFVVCVTLPLYSQWYIKYQNKTKCDWFLSFATGFVKFIELKKSL